MVTWHEGTVTVDMDTDKIRMVKGKNVLNFDDVPGPIDLPLPFGDGTYILYFCRRKSGNLYTITSSVRKAVTGTSRYMLEPNCYVPEVPVAWDYARMLCRDKSQKAAYKTLINWANKTIFYDYIKAATVPKKGVTPDPQYVWDTHRGICQDIASLVTGMLRAVNVPARLVIGLANGRTHAWVEAKADGKTYRWDPTRTKANSYVKERWY